MKKTTYVITACELEPGLPQSKRQYHVRAWFSEDARKNFYAQHPSMLIVEVRAL